MKRIFFLLFFVALFVSCNNSNEEESDRPGIDGYIYDLGILIVIIDEAENDRLNPESPAYFGDDYAEGIKVLYLVNSKKLTILEYLQFVGLGVTFHLSADDLARRLLTIKPPIMKSHEYDYLDRTLVYYYLDCTMASQEIEDGMLVSYCYISYPDGSEDEIKVQYCKGKNYLVKDKLRINGEVVFDNYMNGPELIDIYYNPKFYPWMKTILDSKGNEHLRPEGLDIVVITK